MNPLYFKSYLQYMLHIYYWCLDAVQLKHFSKNQFFQIFHKIDRKTLVWQRIVNMTD